jgi:hypothetical protein
MQAQKIIKINEFNTNSNNDCDTSDGRDLALLSPYKLSFAPLLKLV